MHDYVIKNALLVDPGQAPRRGWLAISGKHISAIGEGDAPESVHVFDADGCAVAPGFVDPHSHVDGDREAEKRSLLQGVTTSIGGNCGKSPDDLCNFYARHCNPLINQAMLCGHSFTLRERVGITDSRAPASATQLEQMVHLAEIDFDAGAIGISFGLDYALGTTREEIMVLSDLCAVHKKLISVHTRMYAPDDVASLAEAFTMARTGTRVLISHLVYQYPAQWIMKKSLEMIESAQAEGLDIWVDSGMYTSFGTWLNTATYDLDTIELSGWRFEDMLVASGSCTGRRLSRELYDALRIAEPETLIVTFTGEEIAIGMAYDAPYVMVSTDAIANLPGQGHPQAAATYPAFFTRFLPKMGLSEAVRRVTSLPAQALRMDNIGRLQVGLNADIAIFTPEGFRTEADFMHPDPAPVGMKAVFVNGQLAARNGQLTGIAAGRFIRRM